MTQILCPDCGDMHHKNIGPLPIRRDFAGKQMERELSGGVLYRCNTCFLKFRHPILDSDVYLHLYDNKLSEVWEVDEERQDQLLVLRHLYNHVTTDAKILDVGCYSGGLLRRLEGRLEKYGVEVNVAAAEIARRTAHAVVWNGLDEIPPNQKFDAILAIDVIEHMPSPRLFIENLSHKLHDGGVLILSTGDGDNFLWKLLGATWWYCSYAEHISFISERWLKYHSSTAGFVLQHISRFRYRANASNWLACAALLTYAASPRLYRAIARVIKSAIGREPDTGIPGANVSRDHLFVALKKAVQ